MNWIFEKFRAISMSIVLMNVDSSCLRTWFIWLGLGYQILTLLMGRLYVVKCFTQFQKVPWSFPCFHTIQTNIRFNI